MFGLKRSRRADLPSIFISYSRADDEPFVRKLHQQLTKSGFKVWWDQKAMESRGLTFLQEIRDAIAGIDRFILVIGPRILTSEYVRQEWNFALKFGKSVTPILRLGELSLLPAELHGLHCIDFRVSGDEPESLKALVRVLESPAPWMGKLSAAVPELTHFVPRPRDLEKIKGALLADLQRPIVINDSDHRVGIIGMAGVGKTILAAAAARNPQVRFAFSDGVYWLNMRSGVSLPAVQARLAQELGDPHPTFMDTDSGRQRLAEMLEKKTCLIILDGVSRIEQMVAFSAIGPRCRTIVTTQDAELIRGSGGFEYQLDVLSDDQAKDLLAQWTVQPLESLPAIADDVARACGNLPLALAMIGAMLQGKPDRWESVLAKLAAADLQKIRYQFPDYHSPNLLQAMEVSVFYLEEPIRDCYLDLAVFKDLSIPENALHTFWSFKGFNREKVQDLLYALQDRSLLRRDEGGWLSLHNVQYSYLKNDYVREEFGAASLRNLHQQLLDAYAAQCHHDWPSGPNDGYFFQHLASHFVDAGRVQELNDLLENQRWYEVRRDQDPSSMGFADDVQIGLNQAQIAVDYPRLGAYSLLWALLTHKAETISLEVIEALTRLGKWRQALSYCRVVTPSERRLLASKVMAEVLYEAGNVSVSRSVARDALQYAESLDPQLAQELSQPLVTWKEVCQSLERKNREDETSKLEDFYRLYVKGEKLDEFREKLKQAKLDVGIIILGSLTHEIEMSQFAFGLNNLLSYLLKSVDFPADKNPTSRELQTLSVLEIVMPAAGAKKIDLDLVRWTSAELLAILGEPERALAMADRASLPMARFAAIAAAARSFGKANRPELVEYLWDLLKGLDESRYVGAKADRCQLILEMAGTFAELGHSEQAKETMGKALGLITLPGLLEFDPKDIEEAWREMKRREALEDLADLFTGDRMLTKVRARCRVLEVTVRYFPELREKVKELHGEQIREEVEKATAAEWKLSEEQFERDHAVAWTLVGTNYFVLGERDKALSYWQRARAAGQRIQNESFRAEVLAVVADAHTRAGDRVPAEDYCRQFVALVQTPRTASSHDEFVKHWAEQYARTGQPERALELVKEFSSTENYFTTGASLALLAGRSPDHGYCREIIEWTLQQPNRDTHGTWAASTWAKLLTALSIVGEDQKKDEVQKQALASLETSASEIEHVESLITFIQTLVREGAVAYAFNVCREQAEKRNNGLPFAAFLSTPGLTLNDQDFNTLVDWTVGTALRMPTDREQYQFAITLLMAEQAIRKSGKDDVIAKRLGIPGSAADACLNKAFSSLVEVAHVPDIGPLRLLNVFRLATGMQEFPPDIRTIIGNSYDKIWNWFKDQAGKKPPESELTLPQLSDTLASARQNGINAVWARLAEMPKLLPVETVQETWKRIRAVDHLFEQEQQLST